jgi:hypothetical protein
MAADHPAGPPPTIAISSKAVSSFAILLIKITASAMLVNHILVAVIFMAGIESITACYYYCRDVPQFYIFLA